MIWWQIVLAVFLSAVVFALATVGGMYLAMRFFVNIFLNDENYVKWVEASERMRKIIRIKGLSTKTVPKEEANGGY